MQSGPKNEKLKTAWSFSQKAFSKSLHVGHLQEIKYRDFISVTIIIIFNKIKSVFKSFPNAVKFYIKLFFGYFK